MDGGEALTGEQQAVAESVEPRKALKPRKARKSIERAFEAGWFGACEVRSAKCEFDLRNGAFRKLNEFILEKHD